MELSQLTVEDYVQIMELLTNDFRFTMYNICYKRVLSLWVLLAFSILLILLFSGVTGLTLFGLGVMWIFINAFAVVFCIWIKIKVKRSFHVTKKTSLVINAFCSLITIWNTALPL
jgi:hypothetical protein